jgi:hypothetical protein
VEGPTSHYSIWWRSTAKVITLLHCKAISHQESLHFDPQFRSPYRELYNYNENEMPVGAKMFVVFFLKKKTMKVPESFRW